MLRISSRALQCSFMSSLGTVRASGLFLTRPGPALAVVSVVALVACSRFSTGERIAGDKPTGIAPLADLVVPSPRGAPATTTMRVDCAARGRRISPLIYGVGLEPHTKPEALAIGATSRRWGGNATSRYNWALGNAWNTGSDWFFENVETQPLAEVLAEDEAKGMGTALTVPMIGWVAKDTTSVSFAVSTFGTQEKADDSKGAGNGRRRDGSLVVPGSPTMTSSAAPPELVGRWVDALRKAGEAGGRRKVEIAILDNEPSLWNSTHRDVRPEPLGYDELLERSIEYSTAIRRADPGLRIAGPAEWGWTGYFFSAKDTKSGFTLRSDRRAHGDEPLVPWYLRSLRAESEKRGVKLLDLLDLHFYPQGDKVYGTADDPSTAALRIRQTRGLWDRSYVDESWIKEPIYLLPRMSEWIARSWPGTGIMIGEWSFGGEMHMSGALAVAEALGRFAEYGVDAAFYWTVPPVDSPVAFAFRAYRDSDAAGARFGDYFIPSTSTPGTSLFASRGASGDRIVLVALNLSPTVDVAAKVDVSTCGASKRVVARSFTGQRRGFVPAPVVLAADHLDATLPAYSITVLDVELASPLEAPVD
jgi:hypothetical protein